MTGDGVPGGIVTYTMFVIVKTESEGRFCFSYVVPIGAFTAYQHINDVGCITVEHARVDISAAVGWGYRSFSEHMFANLTAWFATGLVTRWLLWVIMG